MAATELETALEDCLAKHLGSINATRVLVRAKIAAGREQDMISARDSRLLLLELPRLLSAYVGPGTVARALDELRLIVTSAASDDVGSSVALNIEKESDVVDARSRAVKLAQMAGFANADAVKLATVVSELARNMLQYAGSGTIELSQVSGRRRGVQVIARDTGPGISNLDDILSGKYKSKTGMGLGLIGSKRLMDTLEVKSERGRGTTITAVKFAGA